jgi:hypothetical protein
VPENRPHDGRRRDLRQSRRTRYVEGNGSRDSAIPAAGTGQTFSTAAS